MRRWARTPVDTVCGNCSATIAEGKAIVVISFVDVKRDKIRGECCEGKAPDELPAFESRQMTAPQMTPLKKVSTESWWHK